MMFEARKVFVGLFLLLCSGAFAQSDPGVKDTVYFCDNTLYFANVQGETNSTGFLRIGFFNDSAVQAITIPLLYNLSQATFDSVSFEGGRVNNLVFKTVNFDTASDKVLLGAVPVEEDAIAPGRGLFATLWFTLDTSLSTVHFDTTFFPPSNHLYFISPSAQAYTPAWTGAGAYAVTVYVAGDANNSGRINLADVVFLANYVLKVAAPVPPVLPAGDADGNCSINLADVILLVNFILKNGPHPLAGCVFPSCN